MNDILKVVDECCEKTMKIMEKPRTENKNNILNNSNKGNEKEDEFNKVQKIDRILHDNEGDPYKLKENNNVGMQEIKLDFSGISEIKENALSRQNSGVRGNEGKKEYLKNYLP